MIDYKCAKCGDAMSSPSCMAGKREACPACGHTNRVPNAAAASAPAVLSPIPSAPPVLSPQPPVSPELRASGDACTVEDVNQEFQDPALIYDDDAPWRPWMRKGRLYRAIHEGRYIRVAYQKKDGEEATTRILYPKKITKGRLRADDLTPGKTPGSKLFIVDRITYVELLPKEWTPMELGR